MKKPVSNNKGSLQLSVNAIVIIILAITLLTIGLVFIQEVLLRVFTQMEDFRDQLDDLTKRKLLDSGDEITFVTTKITMDSRTGKEFFAIRNNRNNKINVEIEENFYCTQAMSNAADKILQENPDLITFDTFNTWEVEPQDSQIIYTEIEIDNNALGSIYACKLDLYILEENGVRKVESDAPKCEDLDLDDDRTNCKELYKSFNFQLEYQR